MPRLWILASSASDNFLDFFGAKLDLPSLCEGVYFCAEGFRTAIVAINRLPPTPETLLLRLLGKGATQQQAIKEMLTFPKDDALRNHVEYLLYRWLMYLEAQDGLTEDDQELLMNLSEIVEQRQQNFLQQGRLEERRGFVENLLKLKFGIMISSSVLFKKN